MKELATLELYRKKKISLEEINRVEPRVILVPMFLLEFLFLLKVGSYGKRNL